MTITHAHLRRTIARAPSPMHTRGARRTHPGALNLPLPVRRLIQMTITHALVRVRGTVSGAPVVDSVAALAFLG